MSDKQRPFAAIDRLYDLAHQEDEFAAEQQRQIEVHTSQAAERITARNAARVRATEYRKAALELQHPMMVAGEPMRQAADAAAGMVSDDEALAAFRRSPEEIFRVANAARRAGPPGDY